MSKSSNIQNSIIGTGRPITAPRAAIRGISFSSPLVLDGTFLAGALPAASLGISAVVWVRKTVNSSRYIIDGGLSGSGAGGQYNLKSGGPSNTSENSVSAALGGNVSAISGNNDFPVDAVNWKCVFFFGNSNQPRIFINDTETAYAGRAGAFPINFSAFDNFTIGSSIPVRGAGNNWAQDISDVWVSYSSMIDFSVQANRRLFINASGKSVTIASDGTVNSVRPEFYYSVRAGQALTKYLENRGSVALTNASALMTIRSGALTESLTSPA